MKLPSKVALIDVGPRDGLQNEKGLVPAAIKIELVNRLQDAGFKEIEVTSFVSPKWVPQMGDNAEVMAGIQRRAGVRYSVLTPNIDQRVQALMHDQDLDREAATRMFLAGKQPTGRFVESSHVADLLVFLCGPAGRDITGTMLPVEGGWLAS